MIIKKTDRLSRTHRLLRCVGERPVLSVFLLALVVRVAVAVVLAMTSGPADFVPDSATYQTLATQAASGDTSSWTAYEESLFERTGALVWPVSALFWVLGPAVIAGQLYVAALGAATAAMTTRLALEVLPGRRAAVLAGFIVAFLPSMILWSSVILKDAVVWAALSALAMVVVLAGRSTGRALLGWGLATIGLLAVLAYTRLHTLEIALVAFALAAALGSARWRLPRLAGAVGLLAMFPLAFGMGPGGASFVANSGSLEERRVNNAIAADSAVVEVPAAKRPPSAPAPSDSSAGSDGGGKSDIPSTRAPAPARQKQPGSQLSYVPTGLSVMVLRPYPWEVASATSTSLRFAAVESLLWYPIVLLALVGLWPVRRHLAVLAFPLLILGGTMLMYALTEGNVGTAFRHRGEFVWVVAILAAMGAVQLNTLREARRRRSTTTRQPSASVA